jgi:localization factor PodJL
VSVGEWLNSVIEPSEPDQDFDERLDPRHNDRRADEPRYRDTRQYDSRPYDDRADDASDDEDGWRARTAPRRERQAAAQKPAYRPAPAAKLAPKPAPQPRPPRRDEQFERNSAEYFAEDFADDLAGRLAADFGEDFPEDFAERDDYADRELPPRRDDFERDDRSDREPRPTRNESRDRPERRPERFDPPAEDETYDPRRTMRRRARSEPRVPEPRVTEPRVPEPRAPQPRVPEPRDIEPDAVEAGDESLEPPPRSRAPQPAPRERARPSAREFERETALPTAPETDAARANKEFEEVHVRLDRLTQQLDRIARDSAPRRLNGAPPQPERPAMSVPTPSVAVPNMPAQNVPAQNTPAPSMPAAPERSPRPPAEADGLSVDDAIAEIAERQRALYGEPPRIPIAQPVTAPPVPPPPVPPPLATAPPLAPKAPEVIVDLSALERQLRSITTRIEALRPTSELELMITALRSDLSEIGRQLTEALPRRAVESLQIEVQALATRIDHSRQSGADTTLLNGIERGLSEVRDALHGLTTAENLVGFEDTLKALAQKLDLVLAKEDPATLQQLETAIGALRGIVSHVASNDTLARVAEEVRTLAGKVDALANTNASDRAVSALESRLETLTNALNASTEAGHAVPQGLETMLAGLIEKLEWVQLTHTDHAALGHLEDRIAQLIKRLDASDARLNTLEAVERGLADLLVHIEQIRDGKLAAVSASAIPAPKPVAVDAIERDVAEIKRSDRRTQESLEAVHGTVEHVVDRLAMIESGLHETGSRPGIGPSRMWSDDSATPLVPRSEPGPPAAAAIKPADAAPSGIESAAAEGNRPATPRKPLDPNLPPDHPLEPGSASTPRIPVSAAERIAASEAVADLAKPLGAASEKTDFIAAARRAAQAAAAAPPERKRRGLRAERQITTESAPPSRLRKLLVTGAAVLIVVGGLRIVLHMFQGDDRPPEPAPAASSSATPDPEAAQSASQTAPATQPAPGAGPAETPLSLTPPANLAPPANLPPPPEASPVKPDAAAPEAAPAPNPPASQGAAPARQSSLPDPSDVTGTIAPRARPASAAATPAPVTPFSVVPTPAPSASAAAAPTAVAVEKLPASIGGPTLRAAALAGDAAAEFEVATRFSEGHGVPVAMDQAAHWLERAAKQGLAPAEFRLGGLYEKGTGVKKDLAAARDLYTAAAAKGNGKAMHNLAVLYAEGINGPPDYRSAAHWFRKASDYGITDSQYNLAILYARGIGVEQSYSEAYKWFALAAAAGDAEAGKKRDEIAIELDAPSLAAAQAAVQKWAALAQPDDAVNVKTPPGGWDAPAPQAAKPRAHAPATKTTAALKID